MLLTKRIGKTKCAPVQDVSDQISGGANGGLTTKGQGKITVNPVC